MRPLKLAVQFAPFSVCNNSSVSLCAIPFSLIQRLNITYISFPLISEMFPKKCIYATFKRKFSCLLRVFSSPWGIKTYFTPFRALDVNKVKNRRDSLQLDGGASVTTQRLAATHSAGSTRGAPCTCTGWYQLIMASDCVVLDPIRQGCLALGKNHKGH
jgi:hypothetical protein